MSDIKLVIARIESDFDFNLAVRANPRRALGAYNLEHDELAAFESSGRSLWILVLRQTARDPVDTPDGGLPPPPPPFTVNYSHADWRTDPISLRADQGITVTLDAIRTSSGPSRERAVAELMEMIG
jgi:hypothetical protein